MAKTYLSHAKYIIHQKFEVKGVVDKHDIIGAIFGQSEGIIGEDLDIRELQSSGKIGRIEIELESRDGITTGVLTIPSGADMIETSILAATIEVVDKVGPCDAKFETIKIEDTRATKRRRIVDRAKELLSKIVMEEIPDSQEIINEVRSAVKAAELVEYGPDKLPAGPNIDESEEVILVEGRADVINLLKYNIKNVIAMGGSKIPQSIIDLTKKKITTVFIDGDRGGELDLKKLLQMADIDYVARAPQGKEVEELTKKEILQALNRRVPVNKTTNEEKEIEELQKEIDEILKGIGMEAEAQETKTIPKEKQKKQQKKEIKTKKIEQEKKQKKTEGRKAEKIEKNKTQEIKTFKDLKVDYAKVMSELKDSLKAKLYNEKGKLMETIAVRDLLKVLKEKKSAHTIIFDGIITKRLAELAKNRGVKFLIGIKKGKMGKIKGIELIEYEP